MKVNILGTEYEIIHRNEDEDEKLKVRDGYCDRSVKKIVIANDRETSGFENYKQYGKEVIRHEIIHAFLIESGLDANWQHAEEFGHDETMVDWIAIQFPKLMKAFKEADCL